MIKSMYIHVPFCNNICSYCAFPKVYNNKELIDKYLNALEKEIDKNYKGEVMDTIYIGGGDPACLLISDFLRLLNILNKINKSKDAEITLEANFDSINHSKIEACKIYGINRLSFGIETQNKKHLKLLNRTLDKKRVNAMLGWAYFNGIKNINVDLMYGMKDETLKDLKEDLDYILSLKNITHISTYSLMIEKNTKLYIDKVNNIDEDLDYEMYELIKKRLEEKGFIQYEVSNFARNKYESRHNLTYWNNCEYYGFGLGSSSYIKNKRMTNTKSLSKYIKGEYSYFCEELTKEDKCIYEMILGLRKIKGVDKEKFKKKYNCSIKEKFDIIDLLDKKLLVEDERYIYIPKDKFYIQNEILLSFVGGSSNEKNR